MRKFVELYGPFSGALFAAPICYLFGPKFFELAALNHWSIESLYAAIFDTSSIVCAFLFSFFIFIKTTENEVLSAFRSSRFYPILRKHMLAAVFSSFFLTIATIPLLVVNPKPESNTELWGILLAFWFSLTVYVFLCTARSGYQFISVVDSAYGQRFREDN